jgi:hypothetical protein
VPIRRLNGLDGVFAHYGFLHITGSEASLNLLNTGTKSAWTMNPVQLFRPRRLRTSRQSRTIESDASGQDDTLSIRQYIQFSPVFTFKGRGVLADRSLLL